MAQDKHLMALTDLLRLLILKDTSATELLGDVLWNKLHLHLMDNLSKKDIKDKNNKLLHNLHMLTLKFLANIYQTKNGRDLMQDPNKSN